MNRKKAITIVRYWKSGRGIFKKKYTGTIQAEDFTGFATKHGLKIYSVSHRTVKAC